MFGDDSATRTASVRAFIVVLLFGQYVVSKPMYSVCLAMILAPAPRKRSCIYCFSHCLGNMLLVHVCIPCVWQWLSARAPRAFTHLCCLMFGSHLHSTPMYSFFLFFNDSSHTHRERSCIYCFPTVWVTCSK